MASKYAVQTKVRLSVTFTDAVSGVEADPTTVSLTLSPPDSDDEVVTAGIVRDSAGVYHYDWTGTIKGNWTIRWQGTGAVVAANIPYTIRLV